MKLSIVEGRMNFGRVLSVILLLCSMLLIFGNIYNFIVLSKLYMGIITVIMFLSLLSISFFKGQNAKGELILFDEGIEIELNKHEQLAIIEKFSINDLKYLKFRIHSYNDQKGPFTLFTLRGASGLGNYIEFGMPKRKFEFYLANNTKKNQLINFVEKLQLNYNKVSLKVDKIL